MSNAMISKCPKCGHERTNTDDPDIPKSQCPACRIYYFKYLNQKSDSTRPIAPAQNPNDSNQQPPKTQQTFEFRVTPRRKTNHILHLILTVLTLGIWLLPWLMITGNNHLAGNKTVKTQSITNNPNNPEKIAKIGFAIVLAAILIPRFFKKTEKTHQTPTSVSSTAARTTKLNAATKDSECKKELSCWGNKHRSLAVYCTKDIEHLAKYDFKWTDTGWFESKFSRFKWGNPEKTTLIYLGDKIKLQNGFGAWQNMIYQCEINPDTKTVLNVEIKPGKLL